MGSGARPRVSLNLRGVGVVVTAGGLVGMGGNTGTLAA